MNKFLLRTITIIFMILGIGLIVMGVSRDNDREERIKGYESTEGIYVGSGVYSESHGIKNSGTTYYYVYEYIVNGKKYQIKTDYGSNSTPPSERTIYYNPENPSEAVISGMSGDTGIILGGVFFVMVSTIMFMATLNFTKGIIARCPFRIFEIVQGIVLMLSGIGVVYFVTTGFTNFWSLLFLGIFNIIPIAFIVGGFFLITHSRKTEEEMASEIEDKE